MCESLEIQERVYNKSYKNALCNLKCEETTHAIMELDNFRAQDLKDLDTECIFIKKTLATFTEDIFSNDIQSHDIAEYKKKLIEIEKKINVLKMNISKQREDLEEKERELVEEIVALQKIISSDEFDSYKSHHYPTSTVKMLKTAPVSKNKEVELFQTFLTKTGGHTGGWGSTEHGIFLHCWNKCYGDSYDETIISLSSTKLIGMVQKKLPVLSDEEIEAHKMWYFKYLTLKETQSKSIEMWKALKEANKYQRKLTENKRDETQNESITKITSSVKNMELEEWKRNKENYVRLAMEQKALETINMKEEQLNKFKTNRLMRQINKKWIEEKKMDMERELQKDAELMQQEKAKKSLEANKKIKEYRQRDLMIVNLRKSLINRSNNKFQTQKSNKSMFTKKPQRFLRSKYHELTEQWRRRVSKNEHTESILPNSNAICGVDYLPKLGMPKWRQEMV